MRVIDVTPSAPKPPHERRTQVVAFASAAVLFAAVGWRVSSPSRSEPQGGRDVALAPAEPREELREHERETIDLFRRNSPSVVHITSAARVRRAFRNPVDLPVGTGTGFVWDDRGHIVTNFHVVAAVPEDARRFYVRFDGADGEIAAELIGSEPHKDIAVLRLVDDAPVRLRPIQVGTSSDLEVGQSVFAIGNPFGLDQTLTTGVISGLDREIRSLTKHSISGVIQTDAAINPGNSGGPLLDSSGRLIGVNTAIVSPSGVYAGIGFAVPVDIVRRIVPELIEHGSVARPGLGVELLEERDAAALGLEGLGIRVVAPGSAAEKAGLRSMVRTGRGEYLVDEIAGIDGVEVREREQLFDVLDRKVAGEVVTLVVRRGSRVFEVPVKLQLLR
jgi:S1-C subfamily serine protease